MHRMIGVHLVDQPDLHPVTDRERPADVPVHRPGLAVDELPDHVAGVRDPVDLRHQVLPLQAVTVVVPAVRHALARLGSWLRRSIGRNQLHPAVRAHSRLGGGDLGMHRAGVGHGNRHQLHPAPGAGRWLGGGDLGVHRAGVGGRRRVVCPVEQRHQRVEREHLVRRPFGVVADRLVLGGELGVGAQRLERPGGRAGRAVGDGERAEVVGVIGGAVLQPHLPGGVEQHVDDRALRRREQHLVDDGLAFVPAAVAADQLGAGAADGEVEDPRVRGVDYIQAHDLACCRLAGEPGLAVDQHHVAVPAHRDEHQPGPAERRDVPVLDQQVIQA